MLQLVDSQGAGGTKGVNSPIEQLDLNNKAILGARKNWRAMRNEKVHVAVESV